MATQLLGLQDKIANVVLSANDGFVFEDGTENGAKTLESSEFKPSVSILPIAKKLLLMLFQLKNFKLVQFQLQPFKNYLIMLM